MTLLVGVAAGCSGDTEAAAASASAPRGAWTEIPDDYALPTFHVEGAWGERRVFAFGYALQSCDPLRPNDFCQFGAWLDPAERAWKVATLAGAPAPRFAHVTLSVGGDRFVVWGGIDANAPTLQRNDGGMFDASTDRWTPTASVGAPSSRADFAAVWTGREVLAWGGLQSTTPPSAALALLGDGAAYDPVVDRWRPLPGEGAPLARRAQLAPR